MSIFDKSTLPLQQNLTQNPQISEVDEASPEKTEPNEDFSYLGMKTPVQERVQKAE